MDIALDIKSTACRLTLGPLEKRLIIERGIVFTGLSWAKMLKEVQPSFAARHEHSVNRDVKSGGGRDCGCLVSNYRGFYVFIYASLPYQIKQLQAVYIRKK